MKDIKEVIENRKQASREFVLNVIVTSTAAFLITLLCQIVSYPVQ